MIVSPGASPEELAGNGQPFRQMSNRKLTTQATFPFDVFKTRMQAQSWQPAVAAGTSTDQSVLRRSNPGLLEVMRTAVRNDGWRVCFAGLGPTLVRLVECYTYMFSMVRLSWTRKAWLTYRAVPVGRTFPPSSAFLIPSLFLWRSLNFSFSQRFSIGIGANTSTTDYGLTFQVNMIVFVTFEACAAAMSRA